MNSVTELFPSPSESFWTSLRYFAVSRVVVAALLLLLVAFGDAAPVVGPAVDGEDFLRIAAAYEVLGLLYLAGVHVIRKGFHAQLCVHVITDLTLLVPLMHASGGARSGVGVLLVAAVAAASILSTRRVAMFFAAAATMMVLLRALMDAFEGGSIDSGGFLLAATTGIACFATAGLINLLATRLSAQEALVRQRGRELHRQLAVTQRVIADLPQGVVVLDEHGRVQAMNRSAQALFGVGAPWPTLEPLLAGRIRVAGEQANEAGETVDLAGTTGALPHRVSVRYLLPADAVGSETVLVIEDLRQVEERAQQLKLASMGRLSASISHEIRNPLSAIRHANGLIAEQVQTSALTRLARIVEDNSVRIDRIIEAVLSIARRAPAAREPVDVEGFLAQLLPEFTASTGTDPRRIEVSVDSDEPLAFDPTQLRQVVINLLSNALRYASAAPGAVRMQWRRAPDDRLELRIADDGPGLPPEMIEHAFEPFFTTDSRGTGLGLYLARDLCVSNGAALVYEPTTGGDRRCGTFVVRPAAAAAAR